MYPCINCGRRTAQRVHDLFICDTCGHTWTVEDEQLMAHYLRAQGREPAESEVGEEPAAEIKVPRRGGRRAEVESDDEAEG